MSENRRLDFLSEAFLKTKLTVAKDQVASDLDSETVILHVKTGNYYGLNEVGTRIWGLLQGGTTVPSIRETILNEYDVARETFERDLQSILSDLHEKGLIEVEYEEAA